MDFNESLFPEFLNLLDPTYGTTTSGTPTELTMEKMDEAIRLATKNMPSRMVKEIMIHDLDKIKLTHYLRAYSKMPDEYTSYWGIPIVTNRYLPIGKGVIAYSDGTFEFFDIK